MTVSSFRVVTTVSSETGLGLDYIRYFIARQRAVLVNRDDRCEMNLMNY